MLCIAANQQAQDLTHTVCHSCKIYIVYTTVVMVPKYSRSAVSCLVYIMYLSSTMNANTVSVVCRDRRKHKKHRLPRKRGMSRPNEEPSWRLALQR